MLTWTFLLIPLKYDTLEFLLSLRPFRFCIGKPKMKGRRVISGRPRKDKKGKGMADPSFGKIPGEGRGI